jgi:ethanolamine kinase
MMIGRLHGQFANGLVLTFVEGSALASCLELAGDQMMRLVTLELATWHSPPITEAHLAASTAPMVFQRSRQWTSKVPDRASKAGATEKLLAAGLTKAALGAELDQLEALVASLRSPVVFCHNDALAFNFIMQPDGALLLCDVEYGGYNYRGFDVGNHWCEWTGFELDITRFPDVDQQRLWCQYYLDAVRTIDAAAPNAHTSIEALRREGQFFTLMSELFWIAWALLQAEVSEIDFDYVQYAIDRWLRYGVRKPAVLADVTAPLDPTLDAELVNAPAATDSIVDDDG